MKPPSVLDRYVKPQTEIDVGSAEQSDDPVDLGVFGWLRGVRERAVMLELRHKDGTMRAFGYAWLERIEFNPSEGLMLKFTGATVKIQGRNLNRNISPGVRLWSGLVRHRVSWIQEASGAATIASALEATVIETITVL